MHFMQIYNFVSCTAASAMFAGELAGSENGSMVEDKIAMQQRDGSQQETFYGVSPEKKKWIWTLRSCGLCVSAAWKLRIIKLGIFLLLCAAMADLLATANRYSLCQNLLGQTKSAYRTQKKIKVQAFLLSRNARTWKLLNFLWPRHFWRGLKKFHKCCRST